MKHKICIGMIGIIILFPLVVNARFFEKIENIQGKATIAEPIFKVENLQETIIETINKESNIKEYVFQIKNYELENDGISKRISQVDMAYTIEVSNEKDNFPIKYELYEIQSTQNLLNENRKTIDFVMNKNIEYEKIYRLVVFWENKEGTLENDDHIKIKINSTQIR